MVPSKGQRMTEVRAQMRVVVVVRLAPKRALLGLIGSWERGNGSLGQWQVETLGPGLASIDLTWTGQA